MKRLTVFVRTYYKGSKWLVGKHMEVGNSSKMKAYLSKTEFVHAARNVFCLAPRLGARKDGHLHAGCGDFL